ncbi:3'-5' exonuclease [Mammaliicoccus sciuri]|uniref:3'-5' exonuclease n=1 Tax=Mammaliicoccus sciuri TaxID=1296 RepID=UPI0021CF6B36|nr:3'-5' exonuclease [Mammaliicoccus sciuri]UXV29981.1 3'-5' exonuclease [Mammaliicoccus sciuri]
MKKGSLGCTALLSLLAVFSGSVTVLTGESDGLLSDILLILFFICLGVVSLYFLTKDSNSQNITPENDIKSQSTKYDDNSYSSHKLDDCEIENKNLSETNEKLNELKQENELLRKKLNLKEQYIVEIEKRNNRKSDINNKNLETIYKTPLKELYEFSKDEKHTLDLTYTKARKLTDTFVVIDFETTGLKYNEHEIIQYGIIEYKNGKIINEYSKYFKPNKPVSKRIEQKTGITNEFLQDKPALGKRHLEELHSLIKGKTLVAHNAPFDMKFLLNQFYLHDIQHEKFRVIDTLTYSRRLIKETPNHKLQTLKEYFNLDDGSSHNAINDCRATGNLLLLLLTRE